ncbi:HPP family protein [Gymnodinialimonas ceratoperidinii]|uniref:HPP family protein n=1 Tax=Gymnodinialimonas ceratoperidinii TaxID=2856823 RepID=A0A8F6TTE0_9RHOB|nr:HPP family protein [Gymnodinialimonas ceratoperidinii]QXT38607.1 HPP family protein [Gymnodinialimonas ceratoperidinii]
MQFWHHLAPALPRAHGSEALRAGMGALIGISLCVLCAGIGAWFEVSSIFLVAPLGATAVLLFCVPNSPLAQPWSAVVGNVSAASVALVLVEFVPTPLVVGLAVGAAITVMIFLRALHPPGGAVALLTALSPDAALADGAYFALVPLAVTTVILVVSATLYNRATGRVYPFRLPAETGPTEESPRLGLSSAQLKTLLERFNQSTNLGVADLGRLLAAAEAEAAQHRFDGMTCGDVMTSDLVTIRPEAPLPKAARLFETHRIKSLPVVSAGGAFEGIVLQVDLLEGISTQDRPLRRRRTGQRLVADVMQPVRSVPHDLPVGVLLERLAGASSEVVPVVKNTRLVGILTRSDIIRLLLRGREERAAG